MGYRVMIDPGHGGKDSGAVGYGRTEKADVLRLAIRVGQILQDNHVEVGFTRISDMYETPYTKAKEGNDFGADLFASFHRNSAANPQANGFETLVFSNTGRAKAAADHANAEMEKLGYRNRGTVIRKDLIVLNSTKMEAVLFEVGFISNAGDNDLFEKKFEQQAKVLAASILAAFGKQMEESGGKTPVIPVPPKPEDRFIDVAYQVYTDRWLPEVHSMQDFAGIENAPIKGIRIWTVGKQSEVGNVKYRVHLLGRPKGEWLDWIVDRQPDAHGDTFAGNLRTSIDGVQAVLVNCPGRKIQYRTSRTSDDNYYAFVTNTENEGGFAGVYGKAVDKLQCRIL